MFLGKLDSWEWDSGARDMSPVPKSIGKRHTHGKYQDDGFKVGIFFMFLQNKFYTTDIFEILCREISYLFYLK